MINAIERKKRWKSYYDFNEARSKLNKKQTMLEKDPKELAAELIQKFGKHNAKEVCKMFVDLGLYMPLTRFQIEYFSNVMQTIEKL